MTCNHCEQELIEHYMFLDNEWIYCCTKCGVINANEETVERIQTNNERITQTSQQSIG
jgi:hypothetical protein